jgi:hypothetical protein
MAILDFRLKIEERRRAQGDLGHLPSASLGQYASLSFVVIGRGQREDCRLQIVDLGRHGA